MRKVRIFKIYHNIVGPRGVWYAKQLCIRLERDNSIQEELYLLGQTYQWFVKKQKYPLLNCRYCDLQDSRQRWKGVQYLVCFYPKLIRHAIIKRVVV